MPELTHTDSAFINFRDHGLADVLDHGFDHGFRWINLKRFGYPASAADEREVLAALIADVQFRDDYAGGGVDPDGLRHGPYWTRNITPDAYRAVTEADVSRTLRAWAGPLPRTLDDTVDDAVHATLRAATSCYELLDLGREAFHDWGGVHGEFHEFVVIHRPSASLALIVAADD